LCHVVGVRITLCSQPVMSYSTFSISYYKGKGKGEVVTVNTMKEHGCEEVQLHP